MNTESNPIAWNPLTMSVRDLLDSADKLSLLFTIALQVTEENRDIKQKEILTYLENWIGEHEKEIAQSRKSRY